MDAQFGGGKSALRERLDSPLHNARGRAAPTGVQEGDGSGRMRDEDRYAVPDTDGERQAAFNRDMSVRGVNAEPTLPTRVVNDDPRAVHLMRCGHPHTPGVQLIPKLSPPPHDQHCRFLGGKSKAAARAVSRERSNAEG